MAEAGVKAPSSPGSARAVVHWGRREKRGRGDGRARGTLAGARGGPVEWGYRGCRGWAAGQWGTWRVRVGRWPAAPQAPPEPPNGPHRGCLSRPLA